MYFNTASAATFSIQVYFDCPNANFYGHYIWMYITVQTMEEAYGSAITYWLDNADDSKYLMIKIEAGTGIHDIPFSTYSDIT